MTELTSNYVTPPLHVQLIQISVNNLPRCFVELLYYTLYYTAYGLYITVCLVSDSSESAVYST